MKRKLLFAATLLAGVLGGGSAFAQEDVTSKYLKNADFEGSYESVIKPHSDRDIYQPEGWNVSWTGGDENDMTSLNSECTSWGSFNAQTKPTNGGNNTYWIRYRWGSTSQIILSQKPNLPEGTYTLSADAYKSNYATDAATATINAGGKSVTVNQNSWKNYSVEFTVTQSTTPTEISFSLKQSKQAEIIAAVDNFTLTYSSNYTYALSTAISYAEVVNTNWQNAEVASALASAKSVLANKTDKEAYQATINEALATLNDAINNVVLSKVDEVGDITSIIANSNFETSPTFDSADLGTENVANAQPTEGTEAFNGAKSVYYIKGWELMNTDNSIYGRTFTMPYNSTIYVESGDGAGKQAFTSPANNSSVQESNNSLLFVEANWLNGNNLGVKQTITLPAGKYVLSFDTYVANYLTNATSLCGVSYGNTTNYDGWPTELNTWKETEIEFELNNQTDVTISMGYRKTAEVGGGTSPFLFIDNVKLAYNGISDSALEEAIDAAQEVVDNAVNVGDGVFQTPTSALEGVNSAITAVQNAKDNGDNATKKEALNALSEALNAFATERNEPVAGLAYAVANTTAEGTYLCVANGKVTIDTEAPVYFTAVDGGYAISNAKGEYIFKTGDNYSLSTTTALTLAYVLNANYVEGGYTLTGAKGDLGTDNTTAGSTVYADKAADKNGIWTISEYVPSAVTVTAGYATYVTPTAIDFGADDVAFVVRSTDSETAYLESVTEAPANTPVILKGNGEHTFTSIATAKPVGDNLLKISDGSITGEGIYVLANLDNKVGFYALEEGVNVPDGRVYLDVDDTTHPVKFIGFNFGDDATAIKGVETATEAENAVIYNLSGQRVANPTKGIYIMNGKKVLVK